LSNRLLPLKAEPSRSLIRSGRKARFTLASISLTILTLGAGTLVRGGLEYQNWWGGTVFAPFAILIGMGGLLIAMFAPKAFTATTTNKHSRIRGWPTGKAPYYRDR
jgi:hypothetical protein